MKKSRKLKQFIGYSSLTAILTLMPIKYKQYFNMLEQTIAKAATVSLAWDLEDQNVVDNIRIYFKTAPDEGYANYEEFGPVTNGSIEDLLPETNYCFVATALNTAGESGYSNEVCTVTKPIINVNGVIITENSIRLFWAEIEENYSMVRIVANNISCGDMMPWRTKTQVPTGVNEANISVPNGTWYLRADVYNGRSLLKKSNCVQAQVIP